MTPPDRLTAALADRYRIERELGAGGMATVYLARDLRHDREVAIKVLHPDLGAALGSDRFLSEIKTTARLSHPHILPLLDSGAADGFLFYVMPLVRGETLRTRLERERQLPIDDALRIAREVADALQAAHELGIVHRDIKPENILLQGGHALVADFGIALAVQSAGGARMTQTGLSLGTPQYMSPEQAMGERSVDARADVYALAAVTYEMLAGDPPFTGSSVQAIVAKLLAERPTPLQTLRDTVPVSVEQAVLRGLAKLPADRFATAQAFAQALSASSTAAEAAYGSASLGAARKAAAPPMSPLVAFASRHGGKLAFAMLLGVALMEGVAIFAARGRASHSAETGPIMRVVVASSTDKYPMAAFAGERRFALAPDGSAFAYIVRDGSVNRLAIRELSELEPRLITGSEGAATVAFSPDGKRLAFTSSSTRLSRVNRDGSGLVSLYDGLEVGAGGVAWLNNGEILLSPRGDEGTGLLRINASTGARTLLTSVDEGAGGRYHLSPTAVDGGALVFFTKTSTAATDLHPAVLRLADGDTASFPSMVTAMVLGVAQDHALLVRRDGALLAAPFNRRALTLGEPVQVASGIPTRLWAAQVALSENGTLLYESGGADARLLLVGPDGRGRPALDTLLPLSYPRVSPDGKLVAYRLTQSSGTAIYVTDLTSGAQQRVTEVGATDRPEWSPDGKFLYFVAVVGGRSVIQRAPVDRSGPVETVHEDPFQIREVVPMPDGSGLLYRVDAVSTNRDVKLVSLDGSRRVRVVLGGRDDEKQARPSPDAKWIVYVSDESGRSQVYLRGVAEGSGRIPISVGEAHEPVWSRDGRRIYYREGDAIIEATVGLGPTPVVTARRVAITGDYGSDIYHANYDVAPDGRGLLLLQSGTDERRLVLVLNWGLELANRLATQSR